MSRVKVCHFSSVHHVWDTRVFYRECSSLAQDFDVTLIAIGKDSYVKNGVQVIGIPKPTSFLQRFLFTIWKVFYLAVKQDAAIYHIHDAEMVPFGMILGILGKKVIYDIHENTLGDIQLKPWLSASQKKWAGWAYRLFLQTGKQFMHYVPVVADPKLLHDFYVSEEECTIVQNFADLDELAPYQVMDRGGLEGNHLFYVGMIRDMYYNIDPFLEAIYLLQQQGKICELHLIGYFGVNAQTSFDHLPYWKAISQQIHFYGFLDQAKAYEISKQCKVGLCIKNQPDDMLVSHERKLFEYMCIGLPAIFCDSAIYCNLNNEFQIGIPVDVQSAQAISTALCDLLYKPGLLNELSAINLMASKEKYNWHKEYARLRFLYDHLLFS